MPDSSYPVEMISGVPVVTDTRTCEQCGAPFVPRREHARSVTVADAHVRR